MVRAVEPKKWHKCDGYVCCCTEANPPNSGAEDSVIDVKQEHKKAGKEEEKGKMQEGGQRFNCPGKVKLVDAFKKKCVNPASLMQTVLWLHYPDISTSPLLQHCRQQCARKADDQAQEPERVDPHSIMRRGECGWVGKCRGDRDVWPIGIGK